MNQEAFQELPVAPYPAPPPFWKHFTIENVERIKQADHGAELPIDLNFLRPPPFPASDSNSYKTFSTLRKIDPTPDLPPPEILLFDPTLPTFNHARALKQLTSSLLLNFLELTTVLSNNPVKYEEKMQDIERLMFNVHFVINLYRPHQAREGIKEMLHHQLDNKRQEIQKCDEMKEKVEAFLKEVEKQKSPPKIDGQDKTSTAKSDESRKLWSMIHSIKDE